MTVDETSIVIAPEVRNKVRAQKRGGETYEELLLKMVDQYDPDAARNEV